MGELKDSGQNDGDKKKKAAEAAVVLKMDLHCDGCTKKVKQAVKQFNGVKDVKVDSGANKVTVIGKVDPTKLRERLEGKTHKKVELVSHAPSPSPPSQPKKDGGAEKKPESKKEEKGKQKKVEDEKPKERTVVLKISLHCDGCIKKIKKILAKIEGVESVTVDKAKDLVTLKGTMQEDGLAPYVKDKLKRSVEVAPPKKEEAATDKKDKPDGGKKKEEGKEASNVVNVEANKMEYGGYLAPPMLMPMPMHSAGPSYTMQPYQSHPVEPYYHGGGHSGQAYAMPHANDGYLLDHREPAPQIFSDENPNGCSVM